MPRVHISDLTIGIDNEQHAPIIKHLHTYESLPNMATDEIESLIEMGFIRFDADSDLIVLTDIGKTLCKWIDWESPEWQKIPPFEIE